VLPIRETTDAQWRDVIDTNLSAAFYATRAAWPAFERQGGGVVVNISSAAARDPFAGFAAYGAAKAGLNLFGLSAAREGAAIGVRVHTVAPAATETAMFRKLMTPEQYPRREDARPGRGRARRRPVRPGGPPPHEREVIYVHKTV
jgi:NAD(P)-dependent dehydrogenase (short-subunit alcohol dehydrogenase family)